MTISPRVKKIAVGVLLIIAAALATFFLPSLGGLLTTIPWAQIPGFSKPWPLVLMSALSVVVLLISSYSLVFPTKHSAARRNALAGSFGALLLLLFVGATRQTFGDELAGWPWSAWAASAAGLAVAVALLLRLRPSAPPKSLIWCAAFIAVIGVSSAGVFTRLDRGLVFDRVTSGVISVALLTALLALVQIAIPAPPPAPRQDNTEKAPSSQAAAYRRRGLRAAYVGVDGRVSTSKLQVVLWTLALLFMLLHVFVQGMCLGVCSVAQNAQGAGLRGALLILLNGGLHPEYWALLGFPCAAAVYAKALATGRVATKPDITPEQQDGSLGQATKEAASDDDGMIDLGDLQYLLFSVLALGFVLVTFLSAPEKGIPEVPGLLVGLVGVSAGTYATKKAVETGVGPEVTEVQPATIVVGQTEKLTIRGRGFRSDADKSDVPGDAEIASINGWDLRGSLWKVTEIVVTLPTAEGEWKKSGLWPTKDGLDGERSVDLVVIDDQRIRSTPFALRLRRPSP